MNEHLWSNFDKLIKLSSFFVVSGPSGSGKTLICKTTESEVPNLTQSVSATTRPMRTGEKDGIDYYFFSRKKFEEKRDKGDFIEWANIFGNLYGTLKDNINKASNIKNDLILEIDIQGARQIRKNFPEAVFIFIFPPSYSVLEERLRNRKSDSEESIKKRLKEALKEIEEFPLYDYLIVNDKIEESVCFLKSIIYTHRCRINKVRD